MPRRIPIYMGTVLLEPNRWSPGKVPTFRVSEWVDRFARDGFDGMELWENHAALCSEQELKALEAARLPVVVFNSYAGMGDGGLSERQRAAELTNRLRAEAVKFNVGKAAAEMPEYIGHAATWANAMPGVRRMLCECHAGTAMEHLDTAASAFEAWGDGRFQAIVHLFSEPEDLLAAKMRRLGPRVVTHVHAALRVHAADTRELVHRRVALLRELGFEGSFTLEFTEGTGQPGEDRETMYARALRDLELIRKELDA